MGTIGKVFRWLKRLFTKEKLPEHIKVQANNSFIIIINNHKN